MGAKCENLVFEVLGWKQMFLKTFKPLLMHFIHKINWFECFLHKSFAIFQKIQFSRILIDRVWFLINRKFLDISSLASAWLNWYLINARLIEIGKKKIQFLSIWPVYFFTSFIFRIRMHCIIFCIHLAVLQSYLSLFSHIPCIHFAKFGTQLDLKIDWLIFESFVHFSICYFLCVNCREFFS